MHGVGCIHTTIDPSEVVVGERNVDPICSGENNGRVNWEYQVIHDRVMSRCMILVGKDLLGISCAPRSMC